MAITSSAKKAHRASLRKRVFNLRRKRAMTSSVKDARKVMTPEALSEAYQAIDKAAKRGIIKKNAAARKKSRLAKALAAAKK
ncbi:MAG TPA: 30S ribosomal protein S20 [Candidatus Paceibacterota bacterium]|nr:30S ribosomal protein S20 [Candidatus Paceibacterota bacterium]